VKRRRPPRSSGPTDRDLLQDALAFYAELREKFGLSKDEFVKLNLILAKEKPQGGYDAAAWARIQEAHFGFEIGNDLLGLLLLIAEKTDFYAFKVEDDLEVTIPAYLNDPDLQAAMKKVLGAAAIHQGRRDRHSGGGCTTPRKPRGCRRLSPRGLHFDKGQPLFILEVMKMFNKVPAPFSGTIDKIVIQGGDGTIVQKDRRSSRSPRTRSLSRSMPRGREGTP